MRLPTALLIALSTLPIGVLAQPANPQLKPLYDAHRWFELRNAVARTGAPVFYQIAVESAFNQPLAERDLNALISLKPDPATMTEAREILVDPSPIDTYVTSSPWKVTSLYSR